MRKTILALLAIALSLGAYAQENPRQKELGLAFYNFDQFGLTYRFGHQKALWRFNSLVGNGFDNEEKGDSLLIKRSGISTSLSVGREYREPLGEKFQLRYGFDAMYSYSNSKRETRGDPISRTVILNSISRHTVGVNFVIGFNYEATDKLIIGLELLPYFSYNFGKNEFNTDVEGEQIAERNTSGYSFGLSSRSVLLSLVYRF